MVRIAAVGTSSMIIIGNNTFAVTGAVFGNMRHGLLNAVNNLYGKAQIAVLPEFFDEDCYPNLHSSQLNFPSHYTIHQHHSIASQTHGGEYFSAPPRRPERNDKSYEPHRERNAPQNPNQWGEDNKLISKQPHPCWARKSVVSHWLLSI